MSATKLMVALALLASAADTVAHSSHSHASQSVVQREAQALEPLRRAVAARPDDLGSAVELARAYLDVGRRLAEPRFVSDAQSVLAPWAGRKDATAAVLTLWATALQSTHRFDEALLTLERAIARDPRNAQAWLTKATLLQVQGRFIEARAACERLWRIADAQAAFTCRASVDGLSGRLHASYLALQRVASTSAEVNSDVRAWVQGQLAEMAFRLGDAPAAEKHLRAALDASPDDMWLRAAYADLLLSMDREHEVLHLYRNDAQHDAMLLRLAIAAHRVRTPDAQRWRERYEARRRAADPQDNPHLREHARFVLDVLDRPEEALQLARRNWAMQREPIDVRVYLEAARRAGGVEDERRVWEWVSSSGYEDRMLARGQRS